MWKNIPWERRAEIADQIRRMPDGFRKQILQLAFIEGMSTADIANFADKHQCLITRNRRPISKRRVLQIIAEEVPDYNAYQIKGTAEKKRRKDHESFIWHNEKKFCVNCGAESNLEWHHMIPAFLGGTAEPENMVCLCDRCHDAITAYQRRLYPEHFKAK